MMTRKLPQDIPPIRHKVRARRAPAARSYFVIVMTGMINFGLCALVLTLAGGTSTHYLVLAALSLLASLAAIGARRRRTDERRRVTADYLLSHIATALTLLQWCYVAIVVLGRFSSSQSIIMRSIG
ncbi:hypothetical protein BMW22_18490 [Rhizobium leguminosarum]|uniref:Uncharacterized protein n=1 Tax=Rhizobium leguminosarum TaxID=384 RepID=A0A1L3ZCL6_RHILE|nr:LPXTG cell wall anchor domain-containing protein [Rhizobium leguminosarum]API53348.1 hypothetical protein BMW22_18490 [Rhizobium leguminosarum]